jgi:hypothetical protein
VVALRPVRWVFADRTRSDGIAHYHGRCPMRPISPWRLGDEQLLRWQYGQVVYSKYGG